MSSKNKKIELKEIQPYILNHLQDRSPRLMDIFMIFGYENIYIIEQIIADIYSVIDEKKENEKNITSYKEYSQNGYGQYKCKEYPSVLSSVTSDLESGEKEEDYLFNIMDFQFYLEICLCSTPVIYFTNDKTKIPQNIIKTRDYIPTIVTADANNFCYSYMFYEEKQYDKITLYIPKLFCIISKYQYYKLFHEVCAYIYEVFKSPKVQIPLEVQIYNIVNYTPAPSDCKLQLCLFPYQEFNLQKLNSVNFYNNAQYLLVDRLSGYSQNQINLGLIFNLFSVETIIELFLELCLFTPIIFFSSDNEKMFFVISIFNTLFYPLLDEEYIIITPFLKYFQKEIGRNLQHYYGVEIDENIYKELPNKLPDLENKPNFYILLENEEKKLLSTFNEKGFNSKADIQIDQLHNLLNKIIYEEEEIESKMAKIIKFTKKGLKKIYKEIKSKNLCKDYYETNNEEIDINKKIRNIFYKFNLDISNFIYIYEKEHEEELKLEKMAKSSKDVNMDFIKNSKDESIYSKKERKNNIDDIFYHRIKPCHYYDILKNFCKSDKEKDISSKNMRLPRKIFASFLSNLNSNPKDNREIDYYKIIDSIYYQSNPGKSINFDYLDFYKYYYYNLDTYFSQVFNPKYVKCTSENVSKDIIKHFYTYKKVELDSEFIMKYLCILDQMEENLETLKEKEKIFKTEYLYVSKGKTKNLDILNEIEKYYFENNLLNYKEIIRLCLLYYIILTISKKQLVYFNKEDTSETPTPGDNKNYRNFIYDLFDCIDLFKNKYIEIILSVAYRYFNNSNEENYFFIQPYIDIYEKCVIKRKILKTEEIYDINKAFSSFALKVKNKKFEPVKAKNTDLINHNATTELYIVETKIDNQESLSKISDPKFDGKLIDEKIVINCIYEPHQVTCNAIYSPKKLYSMIKKILKEFYINLEIKGKEDTLKEIGVNLLYYCHLMKNDEEIPLDASKYILLTLEN